MPSTLPPAHPPVRPPVIHPSSIQASTRAQRGRGEPCPGSDDTVPKAALGGHPEMEPAPVRSEHGGLRRGDPVPVSPPCARLVPRLALLPLSWAGRTPRVRSGDSSGDRGPTAAPAGPARTGDPFPVGPFGGAAWLRALPRALWADGKAEAQATWPLYVALGTEGGDSGSGPRGDRRGPGSDNQQDESGVPAPTARPRVQARSEVWAPRAPRGWWTLSPHRGRGPWREPGWKRDAPPHPTAQMPSVGAPRGACSPAPGRAQVPAEPGRCPPPSLPSRSEDQGG